MGASEKPAATFHPGDGPTPRTAADVLWEHRNETGTGDLCSCGWLREPRPGAATPGDAQWRHHVADMLAAAGLLAAPTHPLDFVQFVAPGHEQRFAEWLAEHDREIAAQALRGWADEVDQRYPADVFRPVASAWLAQVHEFCIQHGRTLDAVSAHVMRRAARIARQDADRIAAGEVP